MAKYHCVVGKDSDQVHAIADEFCSVGFGVKYSQITLGVCEYYFTDHHQAILFSKALAASQH